jgi:aminoglycoside phosphotransferase (APT) family kinase protein
MGEAANRAVEVREGEEIDMGRLEPFLRARIEGLGEELTVRQFPSGHSNLTYLIEDGARGYVLRRPPHGAQVKTGHDMGREWRFLSALHPIWPKVPEPIAMCEDEEVLGAPFYVMERVDGVILRGSKPKVEGLDEATMATACDALIRGLAEINSVDLGSTGLGEMGKPEGYVGRQVTGWGKRWEKSRTDAIDGIDAAATWLTEHAPREQAPGLIHNDYKYDNVLFAPGDFSNITGVLDWEMATIGDPLMDLGTTLAYWVEPGDGFVIQQMAFGPTARPGNLDRQGVVDRYAELTGRDVSDALFYYVFGLFKVAVIGQQIYYRYKHGHTNDERFGQLIFAVQALGEVAERAMSTGRLSG